MIQKNLIILQNYAIDLYNNYIIAFLKLKSLKNTRKTLEHNKWMKERKKIKPLPIMHSLLGLLIFNMLLFYCYFVLLFSSKQVNLGLKVVVYK